MEQEIAEDAEEVRRLGRRRFERETPCDLRVLLFPMLRKVGNGRAPAALSPAGRPVARATSCDGGSASACGVSSDPACGDPDPFSSHPRRCPLLVAILANLDAERSGAMASQSSGAAAKRASRFALPGRTSAGALVCNSTRSCPAGETYQYAVLPCQGK